MMRSHNSVGHEPRDSKNCEMDHTTNIQMQPDYPDEMMVYPTKINYHPAYPTTLGPPYYFMLLPMNNDYNNLAPAYQQFRYVPNQPHPDMCSYPIENRISYPMPLYAFNVMNSYANPSLMALQTSHPSMMHHNQNRMNSYNELHYLPKGQIGGNMEYPIYPQEIIPIPDSRKSISQHGPICTLSSISERNDMIAETETHASSDLILHSKSSDDSINYDSSDTIETLSTSDSTNFVKHSKSNGGSNVAMSHGAEKQSCNITHIPHMHHYHTYNSSSKKQSPRQHSSMHMNSSHSKVHLEDESDKAILSNPDASHNEGISFGTNFHVKGTCNPCRFEWTRGCHVGIDCRFCHHESHAPEGCQRVKPSQISLNRNVHIREQILNNLSKSGKQWRLQRNL